MIVVIRIDETDVLTVLGNVEFDGFVWIGAVLGGSGIREAGPGAVVDSFYGYRPGGLEGEPGGGMKIVDE